MRGLNAFKRKFLINFQKYEVNFKNLMMNFTNYKNELIKIESETKSHSISQQGNPSI